MQHVGCAPKGKEYVVVFSLLSITLAYRYFGKSFQSHVWEQTLAIAEQEDKE